ncbi:hypothetical protein ALP25_05498, partial [Pseudomonas syringae pv. syringae]
MVNIDEFCQTRVILVIRLDHELNHVFRVVHAVEQDRRVSGKGLGQTDVGGVALHQIGIVVGSHQLHGFDLNELEFFRVGRDVFLGGLVTNTFLERDQPGLGQQLQAASAVDRVIGDGHGSAGRQLVEAFVLFRVQTYVVDDPRCVRHQAEAGGFVGVGQERDVLKVVHVDIAGSEADIGRDPVGELDQLDLQALLASLFDSGFERYGEGCRGPDFQGFIVGVSGQGQQTEGQCSEGFAHDAVLLKIPKSRPHALCLLLPQDLCTTPSASAWGRMSSLTTPVCRLRQRIGPVGASLLANRPVQTQKTGRLDNRFREQARSHKICVQRQALQ